MKPVVRGSLLLQSPVDSFLTNRPTSNSSERHTKSGNAYPRFLRYAISCGVQTIEEGAIREIRWPSGGHHLSQQQLSWAGHGRRGGRLRGRLWRRGQESSRWLASCAGSDPLRL